LDKFAFRQTQTALTTYWFREEGFKLAYETPVAGFPASIPFEFPIYQLMVAFIAKILNIDLNIVGRLVNALFFIACLIPIKRITKLLNLSEEVFYIFCILAYSTPIYLYWGRAFMIENAALFFTIMAVSYFLESYNNKKINKNTYLYIVFITLAILQKATTALPVMVLMMFTYFISIYYPNEKIIQALKSLDFKIIFYYFILPILIGYSWVAYTDHIKMKNLLGQQLTSSALSNWNWGLFSQRISGSLYTDTFLLQMVQKNIAGILGIAILTIGFILSDSKKNRLIIFSLVSLSILFLVLFPNLYIIHEYYQNANLIYLIYALAICLGVILRNKIGSTCVLIITLLISCNNYIIFYKDYLPIIATVFNSSNRDYEIAKNLKNEIAKDDFFMAFGNDWSSTFAYLSERKSFTAPAWIPGYQKIKANPSNYSSEHVLGGVVSCSQSEDFGDRELIHWASDKGWRSGEEMGCTLAYPKKDIQANSSVNNNCESHIDQVIFTKMPSGSSALVIRGWAATIDTKIQADLVNFELFKDDKKLGEFQGVNTSRSDITQLFNTSSDLNYGFSAFFEFNLPPGQYLLRTEIIKNKIKMQCSGQTSFEIN